MRTEGAEAVVRARVLSVRINTRAPIPIEAAFTVAEGELVAVLGPSGSGKTTVLRMIAGLRTPSDATITCDGEAWVDTARGIVVPPQQRRVGFVFQDYALFPHLTAEANVAIAHPTGDRQHARALLEQVNLKGLEDRRPHALSGGQQQRVALARALARDPSVLLLDEPFSAVDQMTRERLKVELVRLRRRVSIPTLLVTHDLAEALSLADRIAVLHRGTLLQIASPETVRLKPQSATVARLVGQTNVLAGTLLSVATATTPGRLRWGAVDLEIADTGYAKAATEVRWLAPLDQIVLHRRDRPSHGERENPVHGAIGSLVVLGDTTNVTIIPDGAPRDTINVRLPTHAARRNGLEPGARITVSLLAQGLHIFPQSDAD